MQQQEIIFILCLKANKSGLQFENIVIYLKSETYKITLMRKADLVNQISEKTGIPKIDVLVTLETMFKEVKDTLAKGENIYVRGFGSFIIKKRAAKIGRNIKKNVAVHIPEHYIPAFKPAKEFVAEVKKLQGIKEDQPNPEEEM